MVLDLGSERFEELDEWGGASLLYSWEHDGELRFTVKDYNRERERQRSD